MISTNFGHVRRFLLDPSPEGYDKRTEVKTACACARVLALLSSVYSAFSVLSGASVFPGVVFCILDREIYVMANNFERILTTFTGSAIAPNWFISSLLKDTWIVGPIFKDFF